MSHGDIQKRPVVFFDGGCPVCRREIAVYRRLDREGVIDWRDIVSNPDALEGTGIGWETAMKRFHVLDDRGRVRSGVDGFALVWEYLPYWRWAAKLVRGLYLVRPLDAIYRWYARRRYTRRCASATTCRPPP